MRIIAFIFARGGSRGLPGKNTKLLNGKPLLQYSIETAKKLPEISDIFVSTDCDSIAAVAIRNGVHVIQRPSELATDASPEWMAWRHAIEYVKSNYRPFDIFVSLPATSPLRSKEDINSALKKLQTPSADICISVTPANRNPYFNMVRLRPNGFAELVIEPKEALGRRQDAPEVFDMTTAVYAAKVRFIEQNTSVFSGRVVATVVPKCRAVDIDDIYDFMLAEAILKSELVNG